MLSRTIHDSARTNFVLQFGFPAQGVCGTINCADIDFGTAAVPGESLNAAASTAAAVAAAAAAAAATAVAAAGTPNDAAESSEAQMSGGREEQQLRDVLRSRHVEPNIVAALLCLRTMEYVDHACVMSVLSHWACYEGAVTSRGSSRAVEL